MMAVYVETNFVLERSLEQEQSESCGRLVDLATMGKILLVIPAFSLAEPHDAIARRSNVRSRLAQELRPQLRELGRSKSLRHFQGTLELLPALLADSVQTEREGARRAVAELLAAADVIPLDEGVLAFAPELQVRFEIAGQDAIVLASILRDLERRKPESSCFMNRNSNDFDDPGIRTVLSALNCKYFSSFDDGLGYVANHLSK